MKEEQKKLKIFCIVGTRPEFIKMYPVYKRLQELAQASNLAAKELDIRWVASTQHKDLVQDLEKFFKIKADYHLDLKIAEYNSQEHLGALAAEILACATSLFAKEKPDLIFLQGDTLTAQQCGLAAFYQKILIAHVEAGIRTNDIYNPFPEELARRILSQIADLNFAPGQRSLHTLEAEKILFKKKSYNFHTGNTVVDTLQYAVDLISDENFVWAEFERAKRAFSNLDFNLTEYLGLNSSKKIILVTAHRRENFGQANHNLVSALLRIAERFSEDVEIIISVHKNPEARIPFEELYGECLQRKIKNIQFLEAINYPLFLKLMLASYFIVTDSGGIQEEAPYLSKPVLVFRDLTERTEGIDYGLAKLTGTEEHLIHGAMMELLTDDQAYNSMIKMDLQPYGDGLAATRIVDVCLLYLKGLE